MDHKTWIWKKKPSIKQKVLELERSVLDLNEQLSNVNTESSEKDVRIAKHAKLAEDALEGWEKSEEEAVSFKEQLDKTLREKETMQEKIEKMDETLKDYMQRLHVAKEEQEIIIIDSVRKMTLEQEKIRAMEETVSEKNNKIACLGAENSNLLRTLKEVHESRISLESNLKQAKERIDAIEKTNSSLRYELCMLQKELEIRTQEREFDLKSASAAHKQHLESVKKIAKLEAECQKLRVMVRKRLPGPAALAKMKNEVGISGNNTTTTTNNNNKNDKNSFLIERLNAIEEENNTLKETLVRKNNELQKLCAASKLTHLEVKIEEDNASCAESGSWASALISELENFKSGKPNTPSCKSTTGFSELSLMDDFVEMEKLAMEDSSKSCVTVKEKTEPKSERNIEGSVCKIIEFVEGIIERTAQQKYVASAFLWETNGLTGTLRHFVLVCNDLLHGRAKMENFVTEVGVMMDWIVNHCFSLQDVSDMKEAIVKNFEGHESHCCNELELLLNSPCKKMNSSCSYSEMEGQNHGSTINTENSKFSGEILLNGKSLENDIEGKNENLPDLEEKVKTLEESHELVVENKDLNRNKVGEDTNAKAIETDNKSNCCEEVEGSLIQSESCTPKETQKCITGQEEKQVTIDWQITSASEKLAECQETILSLGKQLKALASPKDASLFDKFDENPISPQTKEIICSERTNNPSSRVVKNLEQYLLESENSAKRVNNEMLGTKVQLGTLALVPKRQQEGTNLLRKLLMRRKRESFKKPALAISA